MAKGVKIQIIIHKISGSNLKISPHIFSRFNSIQLKEYFHQFDKYSIKETLPTTTILLNQFLEVQ